MKCSAEESVLKAEEFCQMAWQAEGERAELIHFIQ